MPKPKTPGAPPPPPPESKTYVVISPIYHQDERHEPDSEVELTDEQAASLPKGTVELKDAPASS